MLIYFVHSVAAVILCSCTLTLLHGLGTEADQESMFLVSSGLREREVR